MTQTTDIIKVIRCYEEGRSGYTAVTYYTDGKTSVCDLKTGARRFHDEVGALYQADTHGPVWL